MNKRRRYKAKRRRWEFKQWRDLACAMGSSAYGKRIKVTYD